MSVHVGSAIIQTVEQKEHTYGTFGTPILWPILAGVLIILTNAFFVTVEFAIVTVRRGQIERLAEEGNRSAGRSPPAARPGLGHRRLAGRHHGGLDPARHCGRGTAARSCCRPCLARSVRRRCPFLAGRLRPRSATVLVLLLLSFLHMVIGEQTPKTIALRFPGRKPPCPSRAPMTIFARIATPLVWLVDQSTALVLKLLGIGGQTGGHGIHTRRGTEGGRDARARTRA